MLALPLTLNNDRLLNNFCDSNIVIDTFVVGDIVNGDQDCNREDTEETETQADVIFEFVPKTKCGDVIWDTENLPTDSKNVKFVLIAEVSFKG